MATYTAAQLYGPGTLGENFILKSFTYEIVIFIQRFSDKSYLCLRVK